MHRLSRRCWPGTNLQSVLWFLNHKHSMLGMELSNSVLQTSISILSGRCSLMHLTAFANNMEVGCTLSNGCDSLSYFKWDPKDLDSAWQICIIYSHTGLLFSTQLWQWVIIIHSQSQHPIPSGFFLCWFLKILWDSINILYNILQWWWVRKSELAL